MLVLQKKCYDCRLFLFEHLATKINIEKTESNIVKCVNYLCLNLFIKMPFFSSRNFLNMFCLIAPRQRQILAQFACRLTCLLHVCQSVNLLCLTFVRLFLHIEKLLFIKMPSICQICQILFMKPFYVFLL